MHRNEDYLSLQVYWTDRRIPDHAPVFENGRKRPDIEEWGGLITQRVEDVTEYFPIQPRTLAVTPDNVGYEVWARLQITVDGMNAFISWVVAPPKWRPHNRGTLPPRRSEALADEVTESKVFRAPAKSRWLSLGTASLHEESHPSFIQRRNAAFEHLNEPEQSSRPTSKEISGRGQITDTSTLKRQALGGLDILDVMEYDDADSSLEIAAIPRQNRTAKRSRRCESRKGKRRAK